MPSPMILDKNFKKNSWDYRYKGKFAHEMLHVNAQIQEDFEKTEKFELASSENGFLSNYILIPSLWLLIQKSFNLTYFLIKT